MDWCLRHLVRACGDRFARFLRLKGTFVSIALHAHTLPARTQSCERLLKVNVRAILVRISRVSSSSMRLLWRQQIPLGVQFAGICRA